MSPARTTASGGPAPEPPADPPPDGDQVPEQAPDAPSPQATPVSELPAYTDEQWRQVGYSREEWLRNAAGTPAREWGGPRSDANSGPTAPAAGQ